MKIPRALIGDLDLESAARSFAALPPSLLPSRVAENIIGTHAPDYAAHLDAVLKREVVFDPGDLVWASKGRGRHRPVHALSPSARVLWHALSERLLSLAPLAAPTFDKGSELQSLVVDDSKSEFVVRADVAACYQYIDHSSLSDVIVRSTGDAHLANTAQELLGSVMGRSFGLPQDLAASRSFADLYLAQVEQSMRQWGFRTLRSADDFLLPVQGRPQAEMAINFLNTELYRVGLTLNEQKTRVFSKERFGRESVLTVKIREIVESVGGPSDDDVLTGAYAHLATKDFVAESESTDGPAGDDNEGESVVRAKDAEEHGTALLRAAAEASRSDDFIERAAVRSVARDGFAQLAGIDSAAGVRLGENLIAFDPALVPVFAIYLRRLAESGLDGDAQVGSAMLVADGRTTPGWAVAWGCDPLILCREVPDRELIDALRTALIIKRSDSVRARIALALAVHDSISPAEIVSLLDVASGAARVDLFTALALCADPNKRGGRADAGATKDQLSGWILERVKRDATNRKWM